jgi:hypothetical protein
VNEQIFNSLFGRPGNKVFGHRPLVTIATTLAAATTGRSAFAAAQTNGKHDNKKKNKKCGRNCQGQVANCQEVITISCASYDDPEACRQQSRPCCAHLATCDATSMLECLFDV